VECINSALDFVALFWMMFLLPAVLAVVVMIVWGGYRLHQQYGRSHPVEVVSNHVLLLDMSAIEADSTVAAASPNNEGSQPHIRASFLFCFCMDLLLLPFMTRMLQIFHCVEFPAVGGGSGRFSAAPDVVCSPLSAASSSSSLSFSLVLAAAIVGIVIAVCWLLLLVWCIWPHRQQLDSAPIRFQLGFMWSSNRFVVHSLCDRRGALCGCCITPAHCVVCDVRW